MANSKHVAPKQWTAAEDVLLLRLVLATQAHKYPPRGRCIAVYKSSLSIRHLQSLVRDFNNSSVRQTLPSRSAAALSRRFIKLVQFYLGACKGDDSACNGLQPQLVAMLTQVLNDRSVLWSLRPLPRLHHRMALATHCVYPDWVAPPHMQQHQHTKQLCKLQSAALTHPSQNGGKRVLHAWSVRRDEARGAADAADDNVRCEAVCRHDCDADEACGNGAGGHALVLCRVRGCTHTLAVAATERDSKRARKTEGRMDVSSASDGWMQKTHGSRQNELKDAFLRFETAWNAMHSRFQQTKLEMARRFERELRDKEGELEAVKKQLWRRQFEARLQIQREKYEMERELHELHICFVGTLGQPTEEARSAHGEEACDRGAMIDALIDATHVDRR